MVSLGIDTSNYTTSAAILRDGTVLKDKRILLETKPGNLGLRQSEALYQHWNNLPVILNELLHDFSRQIDRICVSTRPRPQEDSYMPVFNAGKSAASMLAAALGVPLIECSHQEGHIFAAALDNPVDMSKPVLAAHLSGGTLEIVSYHCGKAEIVVSTSDISYGQLLDRTGVMMDFPFPAGKYIDRLASERAAEKPSQKNPFCRINVKEMKLNLSGLETQIKKAEGMDRKDMAYFLMQRIAENFDEILEKAVEKSHAEQVLISGGVAESNYLRNYFKGKQYMFALPGRSSDNAIGVAHFGE